MADDLDDPALSAGGRLRLLDRADLDDEQRRLADRVLTTRAARGWRAVSLLALVGQYLATCAVVSCFRVPAPGA